MKHSNACPKCRGKRIWIIERFRLPGESAEGRPLAIVPHQGGEGSMFRALKLSPQGSFDMHLCDACGYSELWASGVRGLVPDEGRGVRLVDLSDANAGPFR
jgi:predicted nucleic-acid-binding Zn-ribbon protein